MENLYCCDLCGVACINESDLICHQKSHTGDREEFPCMSCLKVFLSRGGLRRHKKIHMSVDDEAHPCVICGQEFPGEADLKLHFSKIHTAQKRYKCKICHKSFVSSCELKKHKKIHITKGQVMHNSDDAQKLPSYKPLENIPIKLEETSDGNELNRSNLNNEKNSWKCGACGKLFTSPSTLKRHQLMAHNKGKKKIYKCKVCSKQFSKLTDLKQHKETAHSEPTKKKKNRKNKIYECKKCFESFIEERTYKLHIMNHGKEEFTDDSVTDDEYYQPSDDESVIDENIENFLLPHEVKMEQVTDSEADSDPDYVPYPKPTKSSQHVKNNEHKNGEDVKKDFKEEESVKNACVGVVETDIKDDSKIKVTECLPKPHICDVCGRAFAHLRKLEHHKIIHDEEKLHKCKLCCKVFLQEANLKRHEGHHLRRYTCESCGKHFSSNSCLKRHTITHTQERQFMCEVCSKKFFRRHDLKRHEAIHLDVKCHVCEKCSKAFSTSNDLRQHMVVHSGLKPYVCETCSHTFARLNCLRKHQLIHTGVKNFFCQVCGKAFLRNAQLKQHMRVHRPGAPPYKYGMKKRKKAEETHSANQVFASTQTMYY